MLRCTKVVRKKVHMTHRAQVFCSHTTHLTRATSTPPPHTRATATRGLVTPHASRQTRVTHHAQARLRLTRGAQQAGPGVNRARRPARRRPACITGCIQPSQAQVGPRMSERRWIVGHAPIAATVVGARPRDARFRLLLELRSEGPRMSLATVRCTSRLDTTWHLAHAAQSSRVQ